MSDSQHWAPILHILPPGGRQTKGMGGRLPGPAAPGLVPVAPYLPRTGSQLSQKDSKLGDGTRRERERVEEVVVGELDAVGGHYVLVTEITRVLNAVMTGAQAVCAT